MAGIGLVLGGYDVQSSYIYNLSHSNSFMAMRYYRVLYFQFQQDHHSSGHPHNNSTTCSYSFLTLFGFASAVILNFLQIKYEDQKGPFQTHPTTMHVAVASLLVYCLLYGIHQSQSCRFCSHPLYRRAMLFFALLSLLSTASVLFPKSGGVFYALCILLSVGDSLLSLFHKIKNRIQVRGYNDIMREISWGFPSLEQTRRRPSV